MRLSERLTAAENKIANELNAIVTEENGQTAIPVDKIEVEAKKPKKQKVSISYTVKAFGENIKKIHEMGFITDEEKDTLVKIKTNAVEKWINNI